MKTTILSVFMLSLTLMSFTAKQGPLLTSRYEFSATKATPLKWKNEVLNLGEIPQNKPASIEFEFKNSGSSPVLITNVQASCGCTTTDYSKSPIQPGESTKIKATYNAAAKGTFKKTITVTTNAEEAPKVLTITGTVI